MNRLVLHPRDIHSAPSDQAGLIDSLQQLQLISEPLQHRSGYLGGERFLQLITFLGCMPYVELDQPADPDQEFCFVDFPPITPRAGLRTGSNTLRPRCPHCNAAIHDWQPVAAAWPGEVPCPRCDQAISAETLRWRENAGLGRAFIEVSGIHPSEAVPSDELLNHLHEQTGLIWKWFYLQ